ncbi:MFS transporter [Actinophytocola sediminis]
MSAQTRRNFTALWLGAAVTNLADGMFKLALPLIAVSMTDSPALVAGATLANTLPWLLFALPAGVLADRVDRRRLIMVATGGRVVVAAVLVALVLGDVLSLPVLYGAAGLLGVGEVVTDTTRMSVIQQVVPRNRMESALAKLTATETVANEFAGPPLGGLLAAAGFALAVGASGIGYLVALLALAVMTGRYRPAAPAEPTMIRADLLAGLRYVWHERTLRTLLLVAGGAAGCWAGWNAVIALYAVAPGPVGLTRSEFGLLIGALGVGGFLGAAAAPVMIRLAGRRVVLVGAMACYAVFLATPAAVASPYLIAAGTFLGGLGVGAWNVTYSALRALIVPNEMMGRYSGVSRLASWGSMPLGALLAGVLAEFVGVRAVFGLGGAVCLLLVVITGRTVWSGDFRRLEANALRAAPAA